MDSKDLDADRAERQAYLSVKRLLGNPRSFQQPRGSAAGFPDFGFTLNTYEGRVDLHFEYKKNRKARLGSTHKWKFDGDTFFYDHNPTEEEELIAAMLNKTPVAKANGQRILQGMQNHFDSRITEVSGTSFNVETDVKVRAKKIAKFKQKVNPLTIAPPIVLTDDEDVVLSRYKRKFKKSIRPTTQYSVLFMLIGNEIWFVDEHGYLPEEHKKMIARLFGNENIPVLKSLATQIEARISLGTVRPRIDVVAESRLVNSGITPGYTIF
jgi:hypothetical protein